jgi:hypothetical protein
MTNMNYNQTIDPPETPPKTPYNPLDPDQAPIPLPPDSIPQPREPVREPDQPVPIDDPKRQEPPRLI